MHRPPYANTICPLAKSNIEAPIDSSTCSLKLADGDEAREAKTKGEAIYGRLTNHT